MARVQRMLDTCAQIVDEVGYEGLTTTLLAERAGVAIGSVYQFFPDKRAVVRALTRRNLEVYLSRLAERMGSGRAGNWWDGVDAAIDEYIRMHRTVPGFRALRFGNGIDAHLLDEVLDNNALFASELARILLAQGVVETDRLHLALTIAVDAADALISLAFRRKPEGDPDVLAETKILIRDYLQRRVAPGSPG
jgi:AcrR family transcriptional regulator